jgi:hypothetical protein
MRNARNLLVLRSPQVSRFLRSPSEREGREQCDSCQREREASSAGEPPKAPVRRVPLRFSNERDQRGRERNNRRDVVNGIHH